MEDARHLERAYLAALRSAAPDYNKLIEFAASTAAREQQLGKLADRHFSVLSEVVSEYSDLLDDHKKLVHHMLDLLENRIKPVDFEAVKKQVVSLNAKAAATARHTETRAMKSEVFQWLDANFYGNFKSMEAAAEAIAGKVVPIKFRTVRDWVGEWKKLRSAGTP